MIQFIAQESGSLFWSHAVMSLQVNHVHDICEKF